MFFLMCAFLIFQSCRQFKKCTMENATNITYPIKPGMLDIFKISPGTRLTYVSNKGDTAYATFEPILTKESVLFDSKHCNKKTYLTVSQKISYTGKLNDMLIIKGIYSESIPIYELYNENNYGVLYNEETGPVYTFKNDTLTYDGVKYSDLGIIKGQSVYEVLSKSKWYLIITADSTTWKQIIKK